MRIQNNIPAYNAHRNYNIANNAIASSAEKLSSGYRINRAGDDAAGLAISEKMRAQIKGLEMASKNSSDAVNLVNTAEGALQKTHDILQRMRELAVQSGSDTNEQVIDRGALQQEFEQLKQEIDDIASTTRFNDQNLIDGTFQKYKMSLNLASTGFKTSSTAVPGMTIIVDQAGRGGAFAVTYTVNAPVVASITGGSAAIITNTSSFMVTVPTAGGTPGVNDLTSTGVSFVGMKTSEHNNNTYSVQVSGSKGSAMTFQLLDSNGQVVSQAQNIDMTSWSNNKVNLTFDGVGTFTFTKETASSITDDAEGAAAVAATFNGKLVTFTSAGAAPTETPAVRGSIDIDIEGEKVRIYKGDTSAYFGSMGIQLKFSAVTDLELTTTAAPKFSGTTIQVDQIVGQSMVIQAGANQGDEFSINIDAMNTRRLGIAFSDISTRANASKAITEVNNALNRVSTQRAALGAMSNRLTFKIATLDISAENLTAAESRIRDVDIAKEMSVYSKKNILSQASTAMLAQANSLPQNVLQLLR